MPHSTAYWRATALSGVFAALCTFVLILLATWAQVASQEPDSMVQNLQTDPRQNALSLLATNGVIFTMQLFFLLGLTQILFSSALLADFARGLVYSHYALTWVSLGVFSVLNPTMDDHLSETFTALDNNLVMFGNSLRIVVIGMFAYGFGRHPVFGRRWAGITWLCFVLELPLVYSYNVADNDLITAFGVVNFAAWSVLISAGLLIQEPLYRSPKT